MVVHTCSCGLTYTADTWRKLALCGEAGDAIERLELRHCSCGSTRAVPRDDLRGGCYSTEREDSGEWSVIWESSVNANCCGIVSTHPTREEAEAELRRINPGDFDRLVAMAARLAATAATARQEMDYIERTLESIEGKRGH